MGRKDISHSKRNYIYERDNHTCVYCGAHGKDVDLTIDHVIPVSAHGAGTRNNLVTSCVPCNLAKGNSILADTSHLPVHGEYAKPTLASMRKHPKYKPPTPDDLWPGVFERQFNLSKAQSHILGEAIRNYREQFARTAGELPDE